MWTTLRVFELLDELDLPPGVVNLVVGGPDIGVHLTSHQDVDMVSFTGSDAVGAQVMSQGALGSLSKSVLELGGKSPNIILPSADLGATVAASVLRFARNAGQGCAAWSRILVPEEKVEEFLRLADDFIKTVKVGDPLEEDTVVGPVISAAHRERVESWIQGALDRGARWGAGGGPPAGLETGHYLQPGLLADVDPDDPIADTELFAPIGIVFGYRDVEHAIELANRTRYGLASNVFGPLDEAIKVAEEIRAGTVTINGGSGMRPDAPWGVPAAAAWAASWARTGSPSSSRSSTSSTPCPASPSRRAHESGRSRARGRVDRHCRPGTGEEREGYGVRNPDGRPARLGAAGGTP